jgi:hypothetical protein
MNCKPPARCLSARHDDRSGTRCQHADAHSTRRISRGETMNRRRFPTTSAQITGATRNSTLESCCAAGNACASLRKGEVLFNDPASPQNTGRTLERL